MQTLPDLLAPNLRLVFIGTAAGAVSARVGAHYANASNKFWPTLHAVGLTPTQLQPHDFVRLLDFGIGLTDLCKTHSGMDRAIPPAHFDVAALRDKLTLAKPRAIAFTSKTGAALYLSTTTRALALGQQKRTGEDEPLIFVLPSPSGAAGPHWRIAPWRELAAWFHAGA
ncbi:MAG: mismatch-specific DNA-glycosylase [Phycisphaerales bacterium]|nr:mismatch-specific DNA-glycosylase [Hyphomonadaceae bacterium]